MGSSDKNVLDVCIKLAAALSDGREVGVAVSGGHGDSFFAIAMILPNDKRDAEQRIAAASGDTSDAALARLAGCLAETVERYARRCADVSDLVNSIDNRLEARMYEDFNAAVVVSVVRDIVSVSDLEMTHVVATLPLLSDAVKNEAVRRLETEEWSSIFTKTEHGVTKFCLIRSSLPNGIPARSIAFEDAERLTDEVLAVSVPKLPRYIVSVPHVGESQRGRFEDAYVTAGWSDVSFEDMADVTLVTLVSPTSA